MDPRNHLLTLIQFDSVFPTTCLPPRSSRGGRAGPRGPRGRDPGRQEEHGRTQDQALLQVWQQHQSGGVEYNTQLCLLACLLVLERSGRVARKVAMGKERNERASVAQNKLKHKHVSRTLILLLFFYQPSQRQTEGTLSPPPPSKSIGRNVSAREERERERDRGGPPQKGPRCRVSAS